MAGVGTAPAPRRRPRIDCGRGAPAEDAPLQHVADDGGEGHVPYLDDDHLIDSRWMDGREDSGYGKRETAVAAARSRRPTKI